MAELTARKADDTRHSMPHEHKTRRNSMGIVQTEKDLQESVEGGPEGGGNYYWERTWRERMPLGSLVTTARAGQ
jgi:arabinogalactan endo-1,4-beta-galactosidase